MCVFVYVCVVVCAYAHTHIYIYIYTYMFVCMEVCSFMEAQTVFPHCVNNMLHFCKSCAGQPSAPVAGKCLIMHVGSA